MEIQVKEMHNTLISVIEITNNRLNIALHYASSKIHSEIIHTVENKIKQS